MMQRILKMSNESSLTPFLHWGNYKSNDQNNSDVLAVLVADAEPFATTYSTNIKAEINDKGLFIIPLHNFESANKALLNDYTKLWKSGKIKDGSSIEVSTWLGVSTRNADKKLRRWKISSIS
jgi:hypothetical protein